MARYRIDDDQVSLNPNQMMELWLGPGPNGSLFGSREELKAAWETSRDE